MRNMLLSYPFNFYRNVRCDEEHGGCGKDQLVIFEPPPDYTQWDTEKKKRWLMKDSECIAPTCKKKLLQTGRLLNGTG